MIESIVERGLRPRPLNAVERQSIVDALRRCYAEAGLPWHGNVRWTPSPSATAVAGALRARASRRPVNLRDRLRRRRPPVEPAPDDTWKRLEERLRRPWDAAPWPLCMPGVVFDENHDPLARVRAALTDDLDRAGAPPDRYDGALDGRLVLIPVIAGMDLLGAPVDEPMLAAFADAGRAGPWWPRADVTVVSEPPTRVHVEQLGELTYRLHNADGPAMEWSDGFAIHRYHGIAVPADLIESGWHGGAVHRHPNSEVRRAGIERIGWARYIEEAGWRLVGTAPDPGNEPHSLYLYEDPSAREAVRVLVMTNGSPDRSGEPRRYAEAVPAHFTCPVDAAAWQYGCPPRVYRKLRRRT